jgi:hypothetical protein
MKRNFLSDLAQAGQRSRERSDRRYSRNVFSRRTAHAPMSQAIIVVLTLKMPSRCQEALKHRSNEAHTIDVAKRKTRARRRCLRRDPLTPRRGENFNIVKLLSRLSLRWCFSRGEHFFPSARRKILPRVDRGSVKENFAENPQLRAKENRKGLQEVA